MSKDADNKKTSGVSYVLSSLGFQFAVGPKNITLSKEKYSSHGNLLLGMIFKS